MLRIEAFQVAELINVKKFKAEFTGKPFYASNYEAFYAQEHDKYIYVLNYGVVVFANLSDVEKSNFINFVRTYMDKTVEGDFKEDLLVEVDTERKLTFNYNSLIVPKLDENVVRIIMLNTAQSVALELYEKLGYEILEGSSSFARELEKYGRVRISRSDLLKFIGRTLNIKNSIIDNLYVFNSPDVVWENEYLEKLDHGLRETFDINTRFRELDYELRIIQDNLKLFTELLQNRESTRLEWIVILLILFEVIDIIISKFLRLNTLYSNSNLFELG
jgi:uncharacterized Rmd1/YagE family protein